jgi:hypothetical protein
MHTSNRDSREFHARELARASHRNYALYVALADREADPSLKQLFTDLAEVAKTEFAFWGRKGLVRADNAQLGFRLYGFLFVRSALGPFLMTQLVLNREHTRLRYFAEYCESCVDIEESKVIRIMLERSRSIAGTLDGSIVHFFAEILLSVQGAFVATVSTLVAFSILLSDTRTIGVVAVAMAFASAIASAATAYMHAEYATAHSPERLALTSGVSYVSIALILAAPFLVLEGRGPALFIFTLVTILGGFLLAFCHSLVLQRMYRSELFHIFTLLAGAVFCAFGIALFLVQFLHTTVV